MQAGTSCLAPCTRAFVSIHDAPRPVPASPTGELDDRLVSPDSRDAAPATRSQTQTSICSDSTQLIGARAYPAILPQASPGFPSPCPSRSRRSSRHSRPNARAPLPFSSRRPGRSFPARSGLGCSGQPGNHGRKTCATEFLRDSYARFSGPVGRVNAMKWPTSRRQEMSKDGPSPGRVRAEFGPSPGRVRAQRGRHYLRSYNSWFSPQTRSNGTPPRDAVRTARSSVACR